MEVGKCPTTGRGQVEDTRAAGRSGGTDKGSSGQGSREFSISTGCVNRLRRGEVRHEGVTLIQPDGEADDNRSKS